MMERKDCPDISAASWAVYDANAGKFVKFENGNARREIASLTKMMTAYTVLGLSNLYNINIKAHVVSASQDAVTTMGTTAGLLLGEKLTVYNMLHALLLPSGNDAAVALAEHFGHLLKVKQCTESPSKQLLHPVNLFIRTMNENAKAIGLKDTHFSNPHGLADDFNRSTAFDVAILSHKCMKLPVFAEIVAKLKHTCYGLSSLGTQKKFEWCQTNRLLWKGFNGIKTGTTNTAGICLSASYAADNMWLIIVVLGCKGLYYRWQDVVRLKDYFMRKTSRINVTNVTAAKKVVKASTPP